MKRLVYFLIVTFASFLYLAPAARAQGTYTAASCNYSDVNAVINGPIHAAANGDTISIPAGTCTWASSLSITKNISIIGSGTPNTTPSTFGAGTLKTVIIDNIPSAGVIQAQINYSSGGLFRLSTLDIEPVNATTSLTSPIQIAGTCTSAGCPNIRLDNVGLGVMTSWSNANDGSGNAAWLIRVDNAFGVIDHCSEGSANYPDFVDVELSAYLGVGGYGDNSWAQPDTMGQANVLYLENNVLYTQSAVVDTEIAPAGGAIGGARYAARFNHITSSNGFGTFGNHGLDTNGRPQGGRHIEAYGNTATCVLNSCNGLVDTRSGTQIVFGNTLARTGSAFYNNFTAASLYRTVYTTSSGWGACGGSSPYDTNDTNGQGGNTAYVYYAGTMSSGTSGLTMNDATQSWATNQFIPAGAPYSVYDVTQGFWAEVASNTATSITMRSGIPEQANSFHTGDSYKIQRAFVCADQGGRGQSSYLSGLNPPSPAVGFSQAHPIYEWDDTAPVLGQSNVTTDTGRLIANRDWYTDESGGTPHAQVSPASPFNGTSGVGFGTLANRPTSCTTTGSGWGVGYFATDQGTWNASENGFGQGQLFVCTAPSTWTLVYTPYTYPHPLVSGGPAGPSGNPVNPPTGLTTTVQ